MTSRWHGDELRFVLVGAVGVVLGVVAVTAVSYLAALQLDVDFSILSRDPAAVVGAPPYTGWFASITILVWQIPASVALFTALLMRRSGEPAAARMFLAVGLISTVMVGDDVFQGHEVLHYNLGVPGEAVFAAYTLAALGWAWWFRVRLGAHVLTVLAAMGCWGVSAVIDTLLNQDAPFVVEDGTKLAGVALWAFTVTRVAFVEARGSRLGSPDATATPAARHRGVPAAPDTEATTPVRTIPAQPLRAAPGPGQVGGRHYRGSRR